MNALTNRKAAWILLAGIAALWLAFAVGVLNGQLLLDPPDGGLGQIWVTFSGGTPAEPGVMIRATLDPLSFRLTAAGPPGRGAVLSIAGGAIRNRIDYPQPPPAVLELPEGAAAATVELYKNGSLGRENEDFTRDGRLLTLQPAPQADDFFTVFWY